MIYLYVGLAGAVGAIIRYCIGLILFSNFLFPLSTLLVNLVGCYILAFFTSTLFKRSKLSSEWKTAIGTGFLGSFTTLSAFSMETVELLQRGDITLAVIYIICSMVGGIVMSNLGWKREVHI